MKTAGSEASGSVVVLQSADREVEWGGEETRASLDDGRAGSPTAPRGETGAEQQDDRHSQVGTG